MYVRIDGEFRSKHFSPESELVDRRRWREQQKARKTLNLPAADDGAPTLAREVATYLPLVTALASYQEREYQLGVWVKLLGPDATLDGIMSADVRRVLERLRKSGLTGATCNKYRTSLMNVYTVLRGKSARNPVRDVPIYPDTSPRIVLPTWEQVSSVLEHARGRQRDVLTVLRYTGWPNVQLRRLTAGDVNQDSLEARLAGRKKGHGRPDTVLPLLPQAARALASYDYTSFWNSEIHRELKRACGLAKVTPFRVYDLRHLFLTTAALAIRDDRVVAQLALHADSAITSRYTQASVDPRVREGIKTLQAYLKRVHGDK